MSFDEGANFGPESLVVRGYIDRKTKKVTRFTAIPLLVPHHIREPYPLEGDEALAFVPMLTELSKKYRTRFRMEGDEIVIEAP